MAQTEGTWDQIRSRLLAQPEHSERYQRRRRAFAAMRALIEDLDGRRVQAGMSKAELARRTGGDASSLRRLFTSRGSSPTLVRFLELADEMGMEVLVVPARKERADAAPAGADSPESVEHGW